MKRTEWFCRKVFCTGVNCPSPRLNSGGRRCTTHRAKTSGVKATEHNARRPSTADICIGWAAQYNTQASLQLAKFNVLGETRIMLESYVAQPHGNTQLLLTVRFLFFHVLLKNYQLEKRSSILCLKWRRDKLSVLTDMC